MYIGTDEALIGRWENHSGDFTRITKAEFNAYAKENSFAVGPIVEGKTDWAKVFGPYDPHRHAFGQLSSGEFVYTDTLDLPGCPA